MAELNMITLRALNGVPVVLNADHSAYHIPSFLPQLIDEAATMTDEEFTELIRNEPLTWRPMPANVRLATAPIALFSSAQ